MKSIKIFFASLAALLVMSGCSSSWLDSTLTAEVFSQEEFHALGELSTQALVTGLYAKMYEPGGASEHDYFGQKSIDLATDIISNDMALSTNSYGWFTDCAQYQATTPASSRNAYIWTYYYGIIMNANYAIYSFRDKKKDDMSANDKLIYAEALAMRAYCYYNLLTLYSPARGDEYSYTYSGGLSGDEFLLVPIYTEKSFNKETGLMNEQPLSSVLAVYTRVTDDLVEAIGLFEQANIERSDKLHINIDVARGLLAYAYLYHGEWQEAYNAATAVIGTGKYHVIPRDKVLKTGFTDVNDDSWMWGLDVTIETSTMLASFWGHIDTHTYSYAYAGSKKAIDENLYKSISEFDVRRDWWQSTSPYAQDYKFYDLKRGVKEDEIDRNWLNDIVYMRIEEMYLIAAEAKCRMEGIVDDEFITDFVDERYTDNTEAYVTNEELLAFIYHNWRIELWGEGKSLVTWKRFNADASFSTRVRGQNHYKNKGENVVASSVDKVYFLLPSGEYNNNNAILKQIHGSDNK